MRTDKVKLKEQQKRLEVLDHPLRKKMIETIREIRQATVEEINRIFEHMPQSDLSRHIGLLRRANFLNMHKLPSNKKYHVYSVNEEEISRVADILKRFSLATPDIGHTKLLNIYDWANSLE